MSKWFPGENASEMHSPTWNKHTTIKTVFSDRIFNPCVTQSLLSVFTVVLAAYAVAQRR
jgi:hypothetical protein